MSQKLKIMLVALFVIIDVVLVGSVWKQMAASDVNPANASGPILPETPLAQATPADSTPEGTGQVDHTASPSGGLALSPGGTLFRYVRGACDGSAQPALTRSSDRGTTFDKIGLPEGVTTILAMGAANRSAFTIVAAGDDCEVTAFSTSSGGDAWIDSGEADVWYVDAASKSLRSPTGPVDPGCTPVGVAAVDAATVRVLCADDTVVGSTNGGDDWKPLGAIDGAVAITFRSGSDGFAVAAEDTCAAQSYVTTDGGMTWKPADCIAESESAQAIAGNDMFLAVLVGDAVYVSGNGGANWSKS